MSTLSTGLYVLAVMIPYVAPAGVADEPALKGAVRELQRGYYHFGRDLIEASEAEIHDPTRFFSIMRERARDQRSLCLILLSLANEKSTKDSLQASMRELERIERGLKDIDRRENYGELSLSLGRSVLESTPFREFLKASGAGSIPAVIEGVTQGQ